MANVLTWITFALCMTTFVRMFTYKRKGAEFHRGVSVCATIVMMASVVAAVEIVTGQFKVQPAAWPMIVMQGVLVIGLLRTKGNLAPLLRAGSRNAG